MMSFNRNMMGSKLEQYTEHVLKIKDPSAKGNVMYDVPMSMIRRTQGSREHCGVGERRPSHRACFCKLFLEGRCGQGEKCKSLHVDPEFVARCRKEKNVVLDDQFINEVVVKTDKGLVYAVRFPAVIRTRGLDSYKRAHLAKPDSIVPYPLCAAHNPGLGLTGTCPKDRHCDKIHVKHSELKDLNEYRLRTPCCHLHGDERVTPVGGVIEVPTATATYRIPDKYVAGTSFRPRDTVEAADICHPHIRSRCKYGRACGKIHICRRVAEQSGLLADLEVAQGLPVTPPRSPKQESLKSALSTPRKEDLELLHDAYENQVMPMLLDADDDLVADLEIPQWNQDEPYPMVNL